MVDQSAERSRGRIRVARALWYVAPKRVEIRAEQIAPQPAPMVMVEAAYSGISRGTERLVWSGSVPEGEWQRMRAPLQAGEFPFPVKYGYSTVGTVVTGPGELRGRNVFALHPHQDALCVPESAVVPLPDSVPVRRATLAANMETALNAVWDGGVAPGDQVVIVGAGVVGLLVAAIVSRLPGARVTVVDVEPSRQRLAGAIGARFALPATIGDTADVVFHTSASAGGLTSAIAACGFEATLVEMSWFGDRDVSIPLGGAFHAKRLRLVSSQVGHVATARRARWTHRRRLEAAIELLADERLDALLGPDIDFADLPTRMVDIFEGPASDLPPVIAYDRTN